jgi:putative DNA primase/helicase
MDGEMDMVRFLQRLFGYALTGSTQEHALFFAHGTGANGKSVLFSTIGAILGDYHMTAAMETFTATAHERHPTELARLRGARLVTAVETEEGRRWAEGLIKTLTGGDRVAARFMRQDYFEYDPEFKLIIAGNHRPGVRSMDEAFRRRLKLIPFNVTIPPEERDPQLAQKLKAEWPGILKWMLEGCHAWRKEGLAPPWQVQSATAAYFEAEDTVSAWIEDSCTRDPSVWSSSSDLFRSWSTWADKAGEHAGSTKRFCQALETRGFIPMRKTSGRGFIGIKVVRP